MRTFVRIGTTTAITALLIAAPLAAQAGHGRTAQDDRAWNDRGRTNDRARADDRGRDDRDRVDLRGRSGDRWRQEQERTVRSYFAGSRRAASSRFARARFPHGWANQLHVSGFFPAGYDFYREPLPLGLERELGFVGSGYDRFMFAGQVVVIDRFTRTIVLAIRI